MSTPSFQELQAVVIAASDSDIWWLARKEWRVTGIEYSDELTGVCVCGQTGLYILYTITNVATNRVLAPIGSSCINHFDEDALKDEAAYLRTLYELSLVPPGERIFAQVRDLLSRKFIERLYSEQVFAANQYNRYDPDNDVRFLLKIFNNRTGLTPAMTRKADVVIRQLISWASVEVDRL